MKTLNTIILSCVALFGFYTSNAQYTATITGTLLGMKAGDTSAVYVDSLGGNVGFYNAMDFTSGGPGAQGRYSVSISTYNDPQTYWVWTVDCKGDTLQDSVTISSLRRQVIVNFNYCNSTPPPTPALSTVSGNINVSVPLRGLASSATALLIKNDNGLLTAVDTVVVGPSDSGTYSFTIADSNSTHMVKAYLNAADPDFGNHLPTYATGALNWSNAVVIPTGGNQTYNHNINLVSGSNPGGSGFIGGLVSQGANKNAAEGDPIANAQVMVMQNGNPVAYTRSAADGKFKIENLAYGTYTVYTEIPGLTTVTTDVTLSAEKPSEEGVKVSVTSAGVTTDVEVVQSINEIVSSAWSGFPNPVSDKLTISLGTSVSNVSVTVVDITGKTIDSISANDAETIEVPMSDLTSGTYFIQVQTADAAKTFKVTKH